jgi:hypothetical protein
MANWSLSPWSDAGQVQALLDPDRDHPNAVGRPLNEWYTQLLDRGERSEAIYFMALALPRYECVVWAAQALLELGLAERTDPAMVAVLRWIDSPNDDLRRQAGTEADKVQRATPAKLLAQAAQFSGGSLAPAEYAPVQPPGDACARFAAGAIVSGVYKLPDPAGAITRVLAIGERMLEEQ